MYLMISRTPTLIGRIIRRVLDNNYNHMSLSMTQDLSQIYSFGRVSARNSMAGGPLKESYYTMSLGGVSEVKISVFKIPVTKTQYERLYEFIDSVFHDADGYVYNFAAAVATIFHRQIKIDKCYTCIEFCVDALNYAGIEAAERLRGVDTLDDAVNHLKKYRIYEGPYTSYPGVFIQKTANDEKFLHPKGFYAELKSTTDAYRKFISRSFNMKFNG